MTVSFSMPTWFFGAMQVCLPWHLDQMSRLCTARGVTNRLTRLRHICIAIVGLHRHHQVFVQTDLITPSTTQHNYHDDVCNEQ